MPLFTEQTLCAVLAQCIWTARAQLEGSAVFGASLALMGEISAKEG